MKIMRCIPSTSLMVPLLCAVISTPVPAKGTRSQRAVRLLETGLYDRSTVQVRNGETWWALSAQGKTCVLRRTVVGTKQEITEDSPGEPAMRVTARGSGAPLFLLQNMALKEGAVVSSYINRDLDAGSVEEQSRPLQLGKRGYIVSAQQRRDRNLNRLVDVTVRSTTANSARRQTLFTFSARDSAALNWAGDLNRDGKLDLYFTISHHNYNAEGLLFLSAGVPGQLVRKVAHWSARKFE